MVTFFPGSYASVCDLIHIQNVCEQKCTVRRYTNQASYFCHVTNILEREKEKIVWAYISYKEADKSHKKNTQKKEIILFQAIRQIKYFQTVEFIHRVSHSY